MAAALIHAGVRPDHAFAVVLVYRLVTRGILLPTGWLAWAGLRRRDHLLSVGRLTAAGKTTREAGIGTAGLPNAACCPQRDEGRKHGKCLTPSRPESRESQ
jgi:hypothetical protein